MTRISIALALWIATAGCTDLTAPAGGGRQNGDTPATPEPRPQAGPEQTAPMPANRRPPPADPSEPLLRIRASHILIAYQGARMSKATRTKEEAKKVAEQVRGRVQGGLDFAKAARDFSDDPSAKRTGGDLGAFDRHSMATAFTNAAFALKVGEISAVVETEYGFHVIQRAE